MLRRVMNFFSGRERESVTAQNIEGLPSISREELLGLFDKAEQVDFSAKPVSYPKYRWFYVPGYDFPVGMDTIFEHKGLKPGDLSEIFSFGLGEKRSKTYSELGGLRLGDKEGYGKLSELLGKPIRVLRHNNYRGAPEEYTYYFTAYPSGEVKVEKPSLDYVYSYFSQLGLELRRAFRMHKGAGLWERTPEHKRDWGNVSEHCLVEAARADVFSELLGFPDELRKDLRMAAAVSDYFKKREKEMTKESGNAGAFALAETKSHQLLVEAGFSNRVIYLADSTGTVKSIETTAPELLDKKDLTDDEIAYLVLHYIDDYTVGSEWAVENAFEERMDYLDERYPDLKESGFNDKQRKVGLRVEERLTAIISQRSGIPINPKAIPLMVDERIMQVIRHSR